MLNLLARLAAIADSPGVAEADLLRSIDLIAEALDAHQGYLIRAGDPDFVVVGSGAQPGEYDVKQKG